MTPEAKLDTKPDPTDVPVRRSRAACSTLALGLVTLVAISLQGRIAAPLQAQEPEAGESVELAPGEVTAQRLIDLLAPPEPKTRGLAIGRKSQSPQPPRCEVYRRRLMRGIAVGAIRPMPSIPIQFAFNSATITPDAARILDEIGKALTSSQLASSCFRLEGHTDSVGSDAFNDRLSRRRAEAVVGYLVAKFGVERQRLVAIGYGKRQPIGDNQTEDGRQRNRRVKIANMGSGHEES